jgi:hypothetical protein
LRLEQLLLLPFWPLLLSSGGHVKGEYIVIY